MGIKLNHTIVFSRDKAVAAAFLTEILGLSATTPFGAFLMVQLENEIALDFFDSDREIVPQHYAFLVNEKEFDVILARVRQRGVPYWADPFHRRASEINTDAGGRSIYFEDPNGHNLEILTKSAS